MLILSIVSTYIFQENFKILLPMLITDFRAALLFAGVMTLCFLAQTISQFYGYSIGPFI